jgi:hypothetical protein
MPGHSLDTLTEIERKNIVRGYSLTTYEKPRESQKKSKEKDEVIDSVLINTFFRYMQEKPFDYEFFLLKFLSEANKEFPRRGIEDTLNANYGKPKDLKGFPHIIINMKNTNEFDEPKKSLEETAGECQESHQIKDLTKIKKDIIDLFDNSNKQNYWKSSNEISQITGYSVKEIEKVINPTNFVGKNNGKITTKKAYDKYTPFLKQVLDLMKNNYN